MTAGLLTWWRWKVIVQPSQMRCSRLLLVFHGRLMKCAVSGFGGWLWRASLLKVCKTLSLIGHKCANLPTSYSFPFIRHVFLHKYVLFSPTVLRYSCNNSLAFGRERRDSQAEGRSSGAAGKISLGWKPNRLNLFTGFYPGLEGNIWAMCVLQERKRHFWLWNKAKPYSKVGGGGQKRVASKVVSCLAPCDIYFSILGIYITVIDQLASHNVLVHWPYHLTILWCYCHHRETTKETFIILNYLGPELGKH